jgi:peptide chain release factor 2
MQELINKIEELKGRFDRILELSRVDEKHQEILGLQGEMAKPGFWDDGEKAKKVSQKASHLEDQVVVLEKTETEIHDLLEITREDKDDKTVNLSEDISKLLSSLEKKVNKLELNLLFTDKHDSSDAIVAIHAGAGGTDAQDWAEMLLRMFLRFCERNSWQTKIINISPGGEAGIKSVQFLVSGFNSYGFLKSEAGVHRLVRISPFDAEKMRHTSFALVEVLPEIDRVESVEVDLKDLRIDTFRASGHGGQGVNTTDSAVRVTHLPTKIVVSCQNERSQQQNKDTAMKIMMSKLQKYYETEVEEEKQKLRGEYTEAAWGNQVRSYVLHPYKMVKDHRTDFSVVDVERVLDGDLMVFVEKYLQSRV